MVCVLYQNRNQYDIFAQDALPWSLRAACNVRESDSINNNYFQWKIYERLKSLNIWLVFERMIIFIRLKMIMIFASVCCVWTNDYYIVTPLGAVHSPFAQSHGSFCLIKLSKIRFMPIYSRWRIEKHALKHAKRKQFKLKLSGQHSRLGYVPYTYDLPLYEVAIRLCSINSFSRVEV